MTVLLWRIALFGGFCATQALAQDGSRPVTVAMPVVREIIEDDEFVGRFEATTEVAVRARISGYLQETHFTDGALVRAGDLLFSIDPQSFEAALRQAEAQQNVAEAQFAFASEQFERAEQLIRNGNIPQSVVDERRQAFLSAQGEIARADAAFDSARIDLRYAEIRAPISGRISRDLVRPGNLVEANGTVMTSIVAIDPIYFYFDINERFFLAYSRDARVRGAALNQGMAALPVSIGLSDESLGRFEGALDFSENRLDRDTGTMRVRALLANPEGVLTPGLFGRINVPGSLPYRGVMLPDEAILADQNRRFVYVVGADDRIGIREVRPGPRIDGWRVIREGLEGTERVVIEGLVMLRPGTPVTPEAVDLPPVRPAGF